jgi:hypothetical protein
MRPKGSQKTAGSGRAKGTPNKTTKALREMILQALDEAGGVEYLTKLAEETPTAFASLLGKILPTTISGDPSSPVRYAVTPERYAKVTKKVVAEV